MAMQHLVTFIRVEPPPPPPPEGEILNISLSVMSPNTSGPSAVSWLVDSRPSIHVTSDLLLLQSPVMHPSPVPFNLATCCTTDRVGAKHATGSVCFVNARRELMWLHNVQFVPSATVNLMYVSTAIKDGAVFHCDPKGSYTRMTGPRGWECSVIHEGGL